MAELQTPNIGLYYPGASSDLIGDHFITHYGQNQQAIDTAIVGKQNKPTEVVVTLAAADWDPDDKTQTVTVTGVTAGSLQVILPLIANSAANILNNENLAAAGIYEAGQAAGALTFYASVIPADDISIRVRIFS